MGTESGFSIMAAFLNFAQLGAEWVMWLMVVLGFGVIVVALERMRLYATTKVDAPAIARQMLAFLENDELERAQGLVARGQAMEERVLADALGALGRGSVTVEQIIAGSLARERQRFDRFLSYLGTVGANAPFIGLFGTVIGIIVSFQALGANPKGGLEVVGPGIAEALVATAVGLLVAIPAVIFYNLFKTMQKQRVSNTDFLARIVLAHLGRSDIPPGGA